MTRVKRALQVWGRELGEQNFEGEREVLGYEETKEGHGDGIVYVDVQWSLVSVMLT